uniref:Uncharacterized protein n=1 Tax=Tanacetum cinerariifolium TaxID=118510 RepID=A0A699I1J0_TANCI|nr:hypothetical protein [Tanacetum cinerariifolium]
MRSDELYKFSDGTLTRLRTSLGGITKNIRMEYLPKRRWSILEKKRANIMIKAIDKQLKEMMMMRSLKNFNRRDLPRDIRLDSVVVLRYEKRSKSENKEKMPTGMELVLEQTQQGSSYEVSVSAEGVKELKRKVKIKGEKNEALLTLRQKPAGNLVKEILLKLNLPDHRSILANSNVTSTKHGRMTKPYSSPRFIAKCFI